MNDVRQGDRRYSRMCIISGTSAVEISVYFSKRGMNYFYGKMEPGGIWLSVSVGDFADKGGYTSFSYTPMASSNYRVKLTEADRYNAKKLAEAAANVLTEEVCSLYADKSTMFNKLKEIFKV